MQQNVVPGLFINNAKEPLHTRNCFKSKIFESKSLKKCNFILFDLSLFQQIVKIVKNKSGLELVTSHYSDYEKVQKNPFIR